MQDDQTKVQTECGIDVLDDKAVVLALYASHEVDPSALAPEALPPNRDRLKGLNAALSLDLAIKVYNKLGDAIEELIRRQGKEGLYGSTNLHS